jgi:hypothetical protein
LAERRYTRDCQSRHPTKTISALAFQDTTFIYYALPYALASKETSPRIDVKNMNDVNARAVGPAAIARRVVAGTVDACARTSGNRRKEGIKTTLKGMRFRDE